MIHHDTSPNHHGIKQVFIVTYWWSAWLSHLCWMIHWLKVSILFSSCGNILEWKLSMKLKRFYGDGSPMRKRWTSLNYPKIPPEVRVEEEKLNQAFAPMIWYAHGRSMTERMHDLLPKLPPRSMLSGVSLLYLCLCISSVQLHSEALTLGEPRVSSSQLI